MLGFLTLTLHSLPPPYKQWKRQGNTSNHRQPSSVKTNNMQHTERMCVLSANIVLKHWRIQNILVFQHNVYSPTVMVKLYSVAHPV
ncbi:UNVERIFIED_CONTAM: hypothetical protein FKN15_048755 [Acipenser sinensis]